MNEFLKFFDEQARNYFPMHLEIYYSKTMDWVIHIWKRCSLCEFPDAVREPDPSDDGSQSIRIVYESDIDIELCFAKAQVALKEWFRKYREGY